MKEGEEHTHTRTDHTRKESNACVYMFLERGRKDRTRNHTRDVRAEEGRRGRSVCVCVCVRVPPFPSSHTPHTEAGAKEEDRKGNKEMIT